MTHHITPSYPSESVREQLAHAGLYQRILSALRIIVLAAIVLLVFVIAVNAAVNALNVTPWLTETFAPEHPNHPKGY
ncbi:hypothetical protein [Pseudosulfitobacter pseudonitzschiae]|uniref:hypothetical protein n=1 Tax=Pseudosulfitobacter pseudonitzschiae TaxID=1402135 RepID=UPI001AFC6C0B|nr:hypothetical protein [Pseudosulfitobacter pseudonitzschiae]MBM1817186.1 hypothetical protein [Pseudosulfitobacter pseudonitzschiae]MBM1834197.1 hypothetical protein [Pseudosulfitobacter pseudonitzschiae]MBM1839062.1 hypothetical protein [Pseudosulfitobacter pseudonitzschiae]MBM1843910.1 hypothetical protein [Pseudosulfitobacter pseudonitzschiae]MBM1848747.1 hypothetical protein [Pseudosulfitobacter pseudonitzschiae]